jgi:hypothetical protein
MATLLIDGSASLPAQVLKMYSDAAVIDFAGPFRSPPSPMVIDGSLREDISKTDGITVILDVTVPSGSESGDLVWTGNIAEFSTDYATRLAARKAEICTDIEALLESKYQDGFNYDFGTATAAFEDGTTGSAGIQNIQTRNDPDRTNWLIFESTINDMMGSGQGAVNIPIPINTASNAHVTVTATEAKTFLSAMKSNGAAKLGNSWALKKQVRNAASIAAAEAVDRTAGWPQ